MTRLFYQNVFLDEWQTEIIDISQKDDNFYIKLEETAFYPEGGGQPSDRGTIDGIPVIDVIEDRDIIYHILKSMPQNKLVSCKLDFERRYDLMQQHTGQHLFSAVFFNKYKGETSSFHLGDDYISVDISIADISPEMAREVENLANSYIFKNLDIITHEVNGAELHKFPLRKLPPTSENIRIVEIDGIDFSPCCGTHIKRTGEIGIIKIIKTEKYKGSTRIYLKCGKRALMDFQNKAEIISELCRYLSVPENEIYQRIKAEGEEVKNLNKQLYEMKEKVFSFEAAELLAATASNILIESFSTKSLNDIQLLSKQILEKGDYVLVLASEADKKVLLSHNGSSSIDFGKLLKENLKSFNGKGGGSPKQAQAAFETSENLNSFLAFVKETII